MSPAPGATLRRASALHKMLMIGAKMTIESGLKFWVCGANSEKRPKTDRSVLRSANSVSEEPACSNNVQKTTLKVTRIIATTIIWNSWRLPFTYDQTRIAGTPIRKDPNSNLPISGSEAT